MTGFQKQVNNQPAIGVEGAIASGNPPATYVTGPGGLVTGANGATIGKFAWASPQAADAYGNAAERVDSNALLFAAGLNRKPSGFLANEQQGLFTTYLAESGMSMLPWQACELFTRGDFWAKAIGAGGGRQNKAFANMLTGDMQPAAAGATIATFTGTASFATSVMTVTVVTTGTVKVGQIVTGANIPADTYVSSLGTGTGGTGTYNLTTAPGTLSAQATTASDYIETDFLVLSTGLVNEIVKIGRGS